MPLVYAIKSRRFILIFLLLLPFSLTEKLGFSGVFIFFLVAYPLLSLDRIGIELQNPFATQNLKPLTLTHYLRHYKTSMSGIAGTDATKVKFLQNHRLSAR